MYGPLGLVGQPVHELLDFGGDLDRLLVLDEVSRIRKRLHSEVWDEIVQGAPG